MGKQKAQFPPQQQAVQPGREHKMTPQPEFIRENYRGSGKLDGKVALITGGDSGIGRAVAVHFAREGAHVAIVYLEEDKDARKTQSLVEAEGRACLLLEGDIRNEKFCRKAVERTVKKLGKLDILVNNAAVHFPKKKVTEIKKDDLVETFETNVYGYFYCTQAALDYLKKGGCIINTTSVTAYRGSSHLIDYASTKGAVVSLTRSLATNLAEKGIRVNGVAPGPIWTPLIPASFDAEKVKNFGGDTPMGRAGQPSEVAPAFVFLASEDASYVTGEVLHVNGGGYVGG